MCRLRLTHCSGCRRENIVVAVSSLRCSHDVLWATSFMSAGPTSRTINPNRATLRRQRSTAKRRTGRGSQTVHSTVSESPCSVIRPSRSGPSCTQCPLGQLTKRFTALKRSQEPHYPTAAKEEVGGMSALMRHSFSDQPDRPVQPFPCGEL
jgi:hypothetical protein